MFCAAWRFARSDVPECRARDVWFERFDARGKLTTGVRLPTPLSDSDGNRLYGRWLRELAGQTGGFDEWMTNRGRFLAAADQVDPRRPEALEVRPEYDGEHLRAGDWLAGGRGRIDGRDHVV